MNNQNGDDRVPLPSDEEQLEVEDGNTSDEDSSEDDIVGQQNSAYQQFFY